MTTTAPGRPALARKCEGGLSLGQGDSRRDLRSGTIRGRDLRLGPSIYYLHNFTFYLDPLPPFLHVIRNGNV